MHHDEGGMTEYSAETDCERENNSLWISKFFLLHTHGLSTLRDTHENASCLPTRCSARIQKGS